MPSTSAVIPVINTPSVSDQQEEIWEEVKPKKKGKGRSIEKQIPVPVKESEQDLDFQFDNEMDSSSNAQPITTPKRDNKPLRPHRLT